MELHCVPFDRTPASVGRDLRRTVDLDLEKDLGEIGAGVARPSAKRRLKPSMSATRAPGTPRLLARGPARSASRRPGQARRQNASPTCRDWQNTPRPRRRPACAPGFPRRSSCLSARLLQRPASFSHAYPVVIHRHYLLSAPIGRYRRLPRCRWIVSVSGPSSSWLTSIWT